MNNSSIRLLTVTPIFLTAMATSALAQEAVMSNPVATEISNETVASVATDTVMYPLKVTVSTDGTYGFTSPSTNALKLSLNGNVLLTVPAGLAEDAEPFQVITSLVAGDHLLEFEGSNLSIDQIALVSMYELGASPVSVASISQVLTAEQAEVLEATVVNRGKRFPGADVSGTQTASATLGARKPFLIGGGSADRADRAAGDTSENGGAGLDGSGMTQLAAANPQQLSAPGAAVGSTATTSSGTVDGVTTTTSAGTVTTGSGTVTTTTGSTVVPVTPTPVVTPPTGTPVTTPPVVVPAEMALASALTPPTNVTLTQAVQITGGPSEAGVVATSGQTLFGQVMDPATFDIVNAVVMPSGREVTVDVGATTGQFAVRLFPEDLANGDATVTVTGASSSNTEVTTVPIAYDFSAGVPGDGITQALSRMTNGATGELYARVREIGFENYVNEQLSPDTIDDSAFEAMNAETMLRYDDTYFGNILARLFRLNLAHSAFSEKQLQEVIGSFWDNHFHTTTKNNNTSLQKIDDREFYRENAFGSFKDLLLYSARSPMMSQFLDNDESRGSTDPDDRTARLNENYGREILELHTVGVDAGYTAEDVIQVALVFTGWNFTVTNSGDEDMDDLTEFEFRSDDHDTLDKVIPFLGVTIPGRSGDDGVLEGEELIAILADDPRTHDYVCGKLVQLLVADEVPASFVLACANAWQSTDGDMGAAVRAILTAPEFITSVELQRNKAKTPYEYAVSVIRALGLRPNLDDTNGDFYDRFRTAARSAGYDPHFLLVPTGMEEVGSAWTSSASMLGKFNAVTDIVERPGTYNYDMATQISDAGLETAEEVAIYMLTIATADRFTLEEYENLVAVLKGVDGIFEPFSEAGEADAFDRAAGLLVVLPSFQLQ